MLSTQPSRRVHAEPLPVPAVAPQPVQQDRERGTEQPPTPAAAPREEVTSAAP